MNVHPSTPVLVGVAAVSQRLAKPGAGLGEREIVVEAARKAVIDSGSRSITSRVGWIGATRGLSDLRDTAGAVAAELGCVAHTVSAAVGIPQQTLVNVALNAIRSGTIEAALVCGGESKWRSDVARRAGVELSSGVTGPDADEEMLPTAEIVAAPEVAIGAVAPAQQYAMIENARRPAVGLTFPDHLDDIAGLWAGFSAVAATNPMAAFPAPRSAESIRDAGPDNHPLAFPYNKWHVSQWSVDQSAALLLCSAGVARECGVPRDRWIFPLVGLESSHSLSLSRRRHLHGWAAMRVLGEAAAGAIGRPLAEIDHMELYSCFPAAVRVQQAELTIDQDRIPSITGGMTFGGGPFNNFVYQATVAMAERLRCEPQSLGLVTAVSGLLTKPGLAVWSTHPPVGEMLVADMVVQAAAATSEVPLDSDPDGVGTVATYTVVPVDRDPARVCAIIDLDSGARAVAAVNDPVLAKSAMEEDLIGHRVKVKATSFTP